MSMQWMAGIAGVLLGIYVLVPFYAIFRPSRSRDPHDGMAIGCLMIVSLACIALGGALAAGYYWRIAPLVRFCFWFTVTPFLLLLGSCIYNLIRRIGGHR